MLLAAQRAYSSVFFEGGIYVKSFGMLEARR